MKAVVLEVRGDYAAVLREDGTVEKLRRKCVVGETIEVEEKKVVPLRRRAVRWAAGAAAALVILTAGGAYGYNNAYAYSYVTLDANPSIEYILNRRNQILSVRALNGDAESIVAELEDVRRASLTEAMDETTELLYAADYLGEDRDNCLLISVASRGEAQQLALEAEVDDYFREDEDLTVLVTTATRDEAEQAGQLGLSTGQYKLMEDILGERPTERDLPAFEGASVGDLMERVGRGPRPGRPDAPAGVVPPDAPDTPGGVPAGFPDDIPAAPDGGAPGDLPGEPPAGEPAGGTDMGTSREPAGTSQSSVPAMGEAPAEGQAPAEPGAQPPGGGASGEPMR